MELYNASLGTEEDEVIELTHEQFEEAKAHFADIIAKGEAARRLSHNDDFQLLILTGYLDEEPSRMAALMASGKANDKVFDDCADAIKAVAKFRMYMKNIITQSEMAEEELESLEKARDLAIKEAAGE